MTVISDGAGSSSKSTKENQLEKAVQWALSIANNNSHGYSNIVGDNNGSNGQYDCGGFISAALVAAGILNQGQMFEPNEEYGNPWSYGTVLEGAGFKKLPFKADDVRRGDILILDIPWGDKHTEFAINNVQTVAAHSNYDGIPGDSSGQEINISDNVRAGWTWIYRLGNGASGSGLVNGIKAAKQEINTRVMTDAELREVSKRLSGYDFEFSNEDITVTKTIQGLVTAEGDIRRTQGAKLLSYPSLVQVPFIILRVGEYSFGTYTKGGDLNTIAHVTYPNFIDSMSVQKVNGTVNQYTINLTYQIEAGMDPNLVDKILSTVGYDLIYISYGDWACPTFIYKEEEALITNVKSQVDFSQSRIKYTITCTSNSIALAANTFNFPLRKAKPSSVILEMLYSNQYGLLDLFTGMRNRTQVLSKGLIASNDLVVEIPSKEGIDPLTYLNYLVSCMSSTTNSADSILRDSTYYLTINDDTRGELGGPYFTIKEVKSQTSTLATMDTYEVDIGFPSDNLVTNFSIKDDNSWALLYNYASKINNQQYVYSLDDKGNILTRYSPNITTSSRGYITTEAQKTWWTNMTQFPITATLEIKGLLRPSMLMSYVRVNAFFYGQRHISSGLYIITRQQDDISSSGYKTTLTLTRIGGDYDYISSVTKKVTTQKPKVTVVKTDSFYQYVKDHKLIESTQKTIDKAKDKAKSSITSSTRGIENGVNSFNTDDSRRGGGENKNTTR